MEQEKYMCTYFEIIYQWKEKSPILELLIFKKTFVDKALASRSLILFLLKTHYFMKTTTKLYKHYT